MGRNSFKGTLAFAAGCFLVLATVPSVHAQAIAQQPLQAAPKTTTLKPGQIDVQMSRAFAKVTQTGLGHDHAIEGRLMGGVIQLGAQQNAGSLVFDMTSYRADTAAARKYIGLAGTTSPSTQQQTNTNMLGASVLDVRKYPTSTFVIDSALLIPGKSRDGHPRYKLAGNFTLHGTTRPLAMNAEVIQEQDRLHLRGGFNINQTNFGITPFKKAFGAVGVADQMTIYGEVYVAYAMPAKQVAPVKPVAQSSSTEAKR